MLRTPLWDCSDGYILMSGTVTTTGAGADDVENWLDERNTGVILKNCVPFIDCTDKINNTQ